MAVSNIRASLEQNGNKELVIKADVNADFTRGRDAGQPFESSLDVRFIYGKTLTKNFASGEGESASVSISSQEQGTKTVEARKALKSELPGSISGPGSFVNVVVERSRDGEVWDGEASIEIEGGSAGEDDDENDNSGISNVGKIGLAAGAGLAAIGIARSLN